MKYHIKGVCKLVCLLMSISISIVRADEREIDGVENDPVAAELRELGEEYGRMEDGQRRALPPDGIEKSGVDLSDEEWLKQGLEMQAELPDPDTQLLPRFLAFAKDHPDSSTAFDAIAFIIRRGGPATGNVHGIPWQLKEQAIDLVLEHHMDNPRIVHLVDMLSGSLPSQKTESFLRHVFENGTNRTTQAAACFGLARYFHHLGNVHRTSVELKSKPKPLNYERFWKIVVTPYLEKNFPYDQAKTSAEIERLLTYAIEEYSDIPAVKRRHSGPSNLFLHTEEYEPATTYGDLAKSLLFERNHLAPGKQAPDIEGTDAAGNRFRLSDYQGKVVLLTFSADWCGGCVKLYPVQRKLVDKLRDQPFVLLSVSLDEGLGTLKKSLASEEIKWRCWWDGKNGQIYETWNRPGVPKIYLLDQQRRIQDVRLNRGTSLEEFEHAITKLLAKSG